MSIPRPALSWRVAAWRVAALLGVVLGLAACHAPTSDPPALDAAELSFDLVAMLDAAEIGRERSRLRPADPADRPRLLYGWSYVETDDEGSYMWSDGPGSAVQLFVARPRDFALIVHCGGFVPDGQDELTVEVEVNGRAAGAFVLGNAVEAVDVPMEADWLRAGENEVRFTYSHALAPADVLDGAQDLRRLALRLYSFELRGLEEAKVPHVDQDLAVLPAGSTTSWYTPVHAGDVFDFAHATADGADAELHWQTESGASGRLPLRPGDREITSITFDEDTLAQFTVAVQGSTSRWASLVGGGEAENVVRVRGGLRVGETPPEKTSAPPAENPSSERLPDVLIYLVDTLRADRLGLYGYHRPTSPRLDAFAQDAVTFTEARAQTSWTRTAVVSMFTGLYPPSHGVELRDDGLPAEVVTLAERLKEAGYQTIGMTTNGNVSAQFGLGQGFDVYQHVLESRQRLEVHRLADHVEEWVATWLGGEDLDAPDRPPFLLYAHATDPHSPYTPREPFRSRFAPDADPTLGHLDTVRDIVTGQRDAGPDEARQLSDLYDAEIAFTDHYFGALLDRLRDLDLYDDMIILFVSDHGEEFFEHEGWEHGRTLYDEQLRVPLVVKLPGSEGGGLRLAGRAGHVDIKPTLLDLLGLPIGDEIDGQSLLPAIRSTAEKQAGGALQLAYLKLENRRLRSLAEDRLKMIEDRFGPDFLFDVAADPTETTDLSADQAIRAGYLKQRLRRLTIDLERDQRQADVVEIDAETREQLEALGYIQ